MSVKSEKVKSGYADLDSTERQEVIRFINEFESASQTRQFSLKESADTLSHKSVGPRNTTACPCCGR